MEIEEQFDIEKMNDVIIDAVQDIKAKDIVKLDLREVEMAPADFFIICTGDSTTQVSSIANRVYKRIKDELNIFPNHFEGKENAQWVLVDYFTTVLHVFYPKTREYYELEDLWSDAKFTNYKEV